MPRVSSLGRGSFHKNIGMHTAPRAFASSHNRNENLAHFICVVSIFSILSSQSSFVHNTSTDGNTFHELGEIDMDYVEVS